MKFNFEGVLAQFQNRLPPILPDRVNDAASDPAANPLGLYFATPVAAREFVEQSLKSLLLEEGRRNPQSAPNELLESITPDISVREMARRIFDAYTSLSVNYHCERHGHPYYPPPSWYEGMRCWCGSELIRED